MAIKTKPLLKATLSTAVRSAGQGGKTTAQDVRALITDVIDTMVTAVNGVTPDPAGNIAFDFNAEIAAQLAAQQYVEITHAALLAKATAAQLLPSAHYVITDYQTKHKIAVSSPAVINTGPVERLVLTASSVNTFFPTCYSLDFPGESMEYDITSVLCEDNVTPRTGIVTFRRDPVNNIEAFYDWRVVRMRRFKSRGFMMLTGTYNAGTNTVDAGTVYTGALQAGISPAFTSTATVLNAGILTVTAATATGLAVGEEVRLTNATGYDGVYVVKTVPNTTSFTIETTNQAAPAAPVTFQSMRYREYMVMIPLSLTHAAGITLKFTNSAGATMTKPLYYRTAGTTWTPVAANTLSTHCTQGEAFVFYHKDYDAFCITNFYTFNNNVRNKYLALAGTATELIANLHILDVDLADYKGCLTFGKLKNGATQLIQNVSIAAGCSNIVFQNESSNGPVKAVTIGGSSSNMTFLASVVYVTMGSACRAWYVTGIFDESTISAWCQAVFLSGYVNALTLGAESNGNIFLSNSGGFTGWQSGAYLQGNTFRVAVAQTSASIQDFGTCLLSTTLNFFSSNAANTWGARVSNVAVIPYITFTGNNIMLTNNAYPKTFSQSLDHTTVLNKKQELIY